MLRFLARRLGYMAVTLAAVSVIAFVLIQLPPGDYLTSYVMQLQAQGTEVSESEIAALSRQYGLDEPIYVQYTKWIWGIVTRGDFGRSFQWNKPVKDLIWERFFLTTTISMTAMVFTFALAIPIGIYAALHKYSAGDFVLTVIGYIGVATPGFLMALILMFAAYKYLGLSVGGLFSQKYMEAAWSFGKVVDLFQHLWIPVIILGTSGTASLIRVMRGMLLDELRKQYVVTARAKGVQESRLIFKYPVRIALNPIVSTIGWRLTAIISGAPIVDVVLNLPTSGPLLLRSLLSQDMYLAGAFILLLCFLTVVGSFISDVLLALMDPRIRMEG